MKNKFRRNSSADDDKKISAVIFKNNLPEDADLCSPAQAGNGSNSKSGEVTFSPPKGGWFTDIEQKSFVLVKWVEEFPGFSTKVYKTENHVTVGHDPLTLSSEHHDDHEYYTVWHCDEDNKCIAIGNVCANNIRHEDSYLMFALEVNSFYKDNENLKVWLSSLDENKHYTCVIKDARSAKHFVLGVEVTAFHAAEMKVQEIPSSTDRSVNY